MKFENDGVVRTTYCKYLHPKHALISDGILHPALLPDGLIDGDGAEGKDGDLLDGAVEFVYPSGCTMDVQSPSWAILSSGTLSFPLKRPICGIWEEKSPSKNNTMKQRGRLMALGSMDIFSDEWFDKESNSHLMNIFTQFLLRENNVSFDRSKSTKEHVEEARPVPDIEALSERLKWCLQENTPLPQDLSSLYCRNMLSFNTSMIPKVMEIYDELNVKHEPLTLILPEFERPSPPLKPAVFQPKMMDLPPPSLDQFDLDEEFAEPSVRLAQLTNKCSSGSGSGDDDLEYYVQEAGSIVGLLGQDDDLDAKVVLHELFQKVSTRPTIDGANCETICVIDVLMSCGIASLDCEIQEQ